MLRFSEDSKSECCGVAKDQYLCSLGKKMNGRPAQESDLDINRRYYVGPLHTMTTVRSLQYMTSPCPSTVITPCDPPLRAPTITT